MIGRGLLLAALLGGLVSGVVDSASDLDARYPYLDDCVLAAMDVAEDFGACYDCGTSALSYEMLTLSRYRVSPTVFGRLLIGRPHLYSLLEADGSRTIWLDAATDGLNGNETDITEPAPLPTSVRTVNGELPWRL